VRKRVPETQRAQEKQQGTSENESEIEIEDILTSP
jgi:hypothetical protein